MKTKNIAEFHSALRAAIIDKHLEEKRKLRFYFDAEVVIRTILGFRQFTDSHVRSRDLADDQMVLRALLSSGYLGRVFLLLPHAFELDRFVRSQEDMLPESRHEEFLSEVNQFLELHHVADKFSDLLEAVETDADDNDDQVGLVMEAIKSFDVSSFVAIELANGTLQQRLIHLRQGGILGFEQRDASFDVMLRDSRTDDYSDIISHYTPGGMRNERRHAIFNDAFGLTQLWNKIQASSDESSSSPLVRFYTEADILTKSISDKRVCDDLSYYGPHKNYSILRPPYYFLLRSYFRSIGFPHLKSAFRGDLSITIDELDEFCSLLEELPEERKMEQWSSVSIKNDKLSESLQNLESLAFFQGIWPSYRLPDGVARLVDGLRDMAGLFREGRFSKEVQRRISREMSGLRAKLSHNTKEMREIFELLDRVERRVIELRENWKHPLPNAMRDIGLVRWGFVASPTAEEDLNARLSSLLKGRGSTWRATCRGMVDELRDVRSDYNRTTVLCAILWFLEDFQLVADFISEIERYHGEMQAELHVMRAAARLRASESLSREQKDALIEDIRFRINLLPEEKRPSYRIGLAYILAYAADFELKLFRSEGLGIRAGDWLRESFLLGCDVVKLAREEQALLRAFALNHCAYVGTVIGDEQIVDKTIAQECMTELMAVEASQSSLWNYRFVDTRLMPRYLTATTMLRYLKNGQVPDDHYENEVQKIEILIAEAREAYARSAGDREITAHQARWKDLENEINVIRHKARHDNGHTIAPGGGGLI